jgi:hypothetical protein
MQCDLDQQRARQTISNPPELASCGPGSGPALGNCDSLKLETCLSYLIRLGTVSNHSLPPSSFFALLTRANVSEELMNSASASEPCDPF